MAQLPESEADIKEKIYNLYIELTEAENNKKETVKAHSENIKRIKAELKDVLADVEITQPNPE